MWIVEGAVEAVTVVVPQPVKIIRVKLLGATSEV